MGFQNRILNFGAGPSYLPERVIQELQKSLWNYKGSGMGILEIYHRTPLFDEILEELNELTRELMSLPEDFDILFLPGGASFQFALIPLNFIKSQPAGFIHTGYWTQKALDEAKRIGDAEIVASSEENKFLSLPNVNGDNIPTSLSYLYYCSNNTIEGTQWDHFTSPTKVPLIVDMSSDFLSRSLEWNQFDLVFAGLQKNLGPAGLSICLIKKHFLKNSTEDLPAFHSYTEHTKANSRLNTPPTLGLYLCLLMLRWLKEEGGLQEMESRNSQKSSTLYQFLDQSKIFEAPVVPASRSKMNIVFQFKKGKSLKSETFLEQAESAGISGLQGHRSRGGFRASLYNAQPQENVQKLISFLEGFEAKQRHA